MNDRALMLGSGLWPCWRGNCPAGGSGSRCTSSTPRAARLRRGEGFLEGLGERVPELEVRAFEAQFDEANGRLLARAAGLFGLQVTVVPVTFVGASEPIVGYRGDATTGALIEERVRRCVELGCDDPVAALLAGRGRGSGADRRRPRRPGGPAAHRRGPPAGGGDRPLPAPARRPSPSCSGALDSFNPCAFFVLFTLLGILVHARSRRRMLFIGGTFVAFSGIVYFIFMAAWLNLFLHIGELRAVTTAAGIVALVIAAINIKDYFFFKRGVSLTIPESQKAASSSSGCAACSRSPRRRRWCSAPWSSRSPRTPTSCSAPPASRWSSRGSSP